MKRIKPFNLFESFNVFWIRTISDVENYIKNNEINEIRSNSTIIHELIAFQIDYENNYDEVLSLSEIRFCISRILESGFTQIDHQNENGDTVLIYCTQTWERDDFYELFVDTADWYIKNNKGEMFLDLISNIERTELKKKYPEKFEKYDRILKSRNFNL